MRILRADISLERFYDGVASAGRRALILDYDGTLAPFRVQRDEAVPYPGVREILERAVSSRGARTIILSGRTVEEIEFLLGVDPLPEIWGAHGWQRKEPGGPCRSAPLNVEARDGLEAARAMLREDGREEMGEEKPGCLALHWRGQGDREIEELRNRYWEPWSELAASHDLALVDFDGGLELRARGRDKAFSVRTILEEMGEGAIAAVLGDDATDEDAFRALGQHGLAVLVRPEPRPTAADLWIEPPGELIMFLERWIEATDPADLRHRMGREANRSTGSRGDRS